MLEALASQSRLRRLLLVSSGAVFGRVSSDQSTTPETWSGAPDTLTSESAYGEGQRVSELLSMLAIRQQDKLEVVVVGLFAFLGPHLALNKHFAFGNHIRESMSHHDILVKGDGTSPRSHLYAADITHWLWALLLRGAPGQACNVGGDHALSIAALAERGNFLLSGKGRVIVSGVPIKGRLPYAYAPDFSRIKTELNVKSKHGLDDAILKTAAWARRQALKN